MADLRRGLQNSNFGRQVQDSNHEITLFRDNLPVLKAECGVTLGLLKLIYSSDESNNGILLGVKPRVRDKVPCLVTFDSTSLNYAEYDLIVQDLSPVPEQLPNTNLVPQQLISQATNTTLPERDFVRDQENVLSDSRFLGVSSSSQKTFEPIRGPSFIGSSELKPDRAPGQSIPTTGIDFCEGSTSRGLMGMGQESEENHHSPDSNSVQFEMNLGLLEPQASVPKKNTRLNRGKEDTSYENEENPEPDSTENLEDFQFNPEDFDFDINGVIPTQTEKGVRWPCDRCGKDYCSSSHLKRHWILHTTFKPYKCKICNKNFPFHWDLKKHMTKHTGNKRFKCPQCTKSFNTRKELRCHNWLHTGKKEYKCQICNHEFTSPGNLKVHTRKHTGEKPYKCDYCPKAFHMLGHYQYHLRRHTGEKPYKCDVCGKAFSYSNNLNEHKNIHTGAKPYSCPKCDKHFAHRSTLKQHILVHEGQRPYKCHLCPKTFVQSSNYRMHLVTHKNKEERVQKCDLCGKELLSRRGVKKHRLRCVKRTVERANLVPTNKKKQAKKGEYPCEHCKRVFSYRAHFDIHVEKKHSKDSVVEPKLSTSKRCRGKVECPICHRQFVYMKCLKEHLQKRHSGVEVPEELASKRNISNSTSTISSLSAVSSFTTPASGVNSQVTSSGTPQGAYTAVASSRLSTIPLHTLSNLPRVHIQPAGAQMCVPANVTIVYVPATPLQQQGQQVLPVSSTGSTGNPIRYIPIVPKPTVEATSGTTNYATSTRGPSSFTSSASSTQSSRSLSIASGVATVTGSQSLSALEQLSKQITMDGNKREETGSQAITALKRLSAKVGMEDHLQVLPHRTGEQRPPSSEHLSALEQLSKRIGNNNAVPIEPVLDPKTQIPLRYPRLEQAVNVDEGGEESSREGSGDISATTRKENEGIEEGDNNCVDQRCREPVLSTGQDSRQGGEGKNTTQSETEHL